MSNTATLIKTQDAQPMGEYHKTHLDLCKESAEMLLIQVGPLVVRTALPLAGRGIKKINDGLFQLSEVAWDKIRVAHTWATDF